MFATDGLLGGKPHPRVYGSYPRVLGYYCRERKTLALEDAVRKATSLPAQRLGLKDRGTIAEGKAADIVVFDPATVIDKATYVDPRIYPEGIPYVFVNGEPVVSAGQGTQKRPGRVVRRGR
jgi:N-acyl-D-amino-acid deacylase